MRTYRLSELTDAERRELLRRGGVEDQSTTDSVRAIADDVRRRGDAALLELTERFDRVRLERLRVPSDEIREARRQADRNIVDALEVAIANIRRFHAAQDVATGPVETMPGVVCRREARAIDRVGLYVPAGSAPLPSTVLMLGVPARVAGCGRIVLCSPPRADGHVDRLVLAAADLLGIDEVYAVGGAQAIAAMAYGTESVPRVDRIFGPGNRYVAAAKRFVAADPDGAAIDLVAGPSELLIIADATAEPISVAADLLSQAEHDPDSQVVLVTDSPSLAVAAVEEVDRRRASLPRADIVAAALDDSFVLIADSIDDAVAFSNDYAPEHLSINVEEPERVAADIRAAGSVFLGPWAPVTAGDYASGTNHTLPTGGTARAGGGLCLDDFRTWITFQTLSRDGLERLAPTLEALADAEGLEAHRRAVRCRLDTMELQSKS